MRTLMNIEMISNKGVNHSNDMESITYGKPVSSGSRMSTEKMGFSLDITGKVRENAAYGKEELKSADDIAQMAGMTDVSVQSDYMAVMSNSMSDEDFAKLMEDGADPAKIPAGEMVTNLDRIKIKMAEAGTKIAGYNDDLSEEDIKAVLGSSINAGKIISDTLASSDLAVNPDMVSEVGKTVKMAANLKPLSEEAKAFMITRDLAPTVENLYMAEYSAAGSASLSSGVHYEGAATYAGSEYTMSSWDDLKDQASAVIEEAGFPNTEEILDDARWIAKRQIPLTKETLTAYENIKELSVPADPRDLIAAITVAIEEGKSPKQADLSRTKSLYEKASDIVDYFRDLNDPADITRRRQLEEVRLVMTKEANLMLLRKGINIETEPLEKLVEELKEAERSFYEPVLSDSESPYESKEARIEDLDHKIDLYKQTRQAVESIPMMPVRSVAAVNEAGDFSLQAVAKEGEALKASYEKAGEAYETLMTVPRADMGDSIRKAFRNVDEILGDLEMDLNDANRKAVRTLGYAGMMINRESVDEIRNATRSVERVIELMTPAKTLSMIREGHNPLTENIFDLERSLSEEGFEETGEKYSRFLLRLEKSGKITEDEKQTFIGMYRLFNAVEKQDGKVIGNVLSSGKALTLENMLEASRSNRHMNGEYVIDDDFGFLEQIVEKGESITAQLARTFTQLMAPETDKEYIDEKQRQIRAAGKAPQQAQEILSAIEAPITVENILAVNAMTGGMGPGYKKLFSGQKGSDELKEEDAKELLEGFTDEESAKDSYESFLSKAKKVAKASALSSDTREDVMAYQMLYKQVGFASALRQKESYEVPVYLKDGWTSIHLTVVHGKEGSGKVRASFECEEYGRVEATFSQKKTGIDGFIVSDSRPGVENLKKIDDKIKEGFNKDHMDVANLSYVFAGGRNPAYIPESDGSDVSDNRLYRIAKAFIEAIQ